MTETRDRSGWDVRTWCGAVGISRALWYELEPAYLPVSTKIGKRRIIIEPPSDWLQRISQLGGVPTSSKPSAP